MPEMTNDRVVIDFCIFSHSCLHGLCVSTQLIFTEQALLPPIFIPVGRNKCNLEALQEVKVKRGMFLSMKNLGKLQTFLR